MNQVQLRTFFYTGGKSVCPEVENLQAVLKQINSVLSSFTLLSSVYQISICFSNGASGFSLCQYNDYVLSLKYLFIHVFGSFIHLV